ncbi:MAG: lipoprotein [Pseudomonadota bacterium]
MLIRILFLYCLLIFSTITLVGCGQMGDLYLPDEKESEKKS